MKTVLTLVLGQGLLHVEEVVSPGPGHEFKRLGFVGQIGGETLRASRAVSIGHPGARPRLRVACRAEAVDAHRRRSVRNAQENLDGIQRTGHGHDESLDETVACLDTWTG